MLTYEQCAMIEYQAKKDHRTELEAEIRKGWLPPEVREQVKKYLLELKDRIHDRNYHASFWKDCKIEECFAIRAALDRLGGK